MGEQKFHVSKRFSDEKKMIMVDIVPVTFPPGEFHPSGPFFGLENFPGNQVQGLAQKNTGGE